MYDVIVVGAGPAGSTTAYECATRGLSVLLLDKAEFPRDKPCGGGVTVRAANLLPFDLTPVVERTISGMYISYRRGDGFGRTFPNVVTYLTQRRHLDQFLVEKAVEAGTTFVPHAGVKELLRTENTVEILASGKWYESKALVAADGANGVTANLAGIQAKFEKGVALEGNIACSENIAGRWREAIEFDIGDVPGGYGWVFAKGDHLNIGVGGWSTVGPTLRARLDRLTRSYGFDPADLIELRGHYLPVRLKHSRLVNRNSLAVGDAAGLLDPLTGEGIFAAIYSGQVAARHLAAYVSGTVPNLDGYETELHMTLVPELEAGRTLHRLFHTMPGFFAGLPRRSPRTWNAVSKLMRGDRTYLDVKKRLGSVWSLLAIMAFVSYSVLTLKALLAKRVRGKSERRAGTIPQTSQ
ncbi:MAG: NAD(P)/FAD-dependent oxidoreductase [Chloroflexi bacterium]|nr:NAD(P)/FAD-dependent oxidoreductase [Chloroflexota bacterium]